MHCACRKHLSPMPGSSEVTPSHPSTMLVACRSVRSSLSWGMKPLLVLPEFAEGPPCPHSTWNSRSGLVRGGLTAALDLNSQTPVSEWELRLMRRIAGYIWRRSACGGAFYSVESKYVAVANTTAATVKRPSAAH